MGRLAAAHLFLVMDRIEMAKAKLAKQTKPDVPFTDEDLLSSGSTLLNLSVSGSVDGLYCKGRYTYVVGDSQSGKTWLVLTALAEACGNQAFDEYRLIYDDAEDGALMKLEKFFGKSVVERIEPPAWDENNEEKHSETIEDFYYHLDDAHEEGKPFIYVLDSMDSLTTTAEDKKFEEKKKAARGLKSKEAGTYGVDKAKANSQHLRRARARLKATDSILIIISQTRDNINPISFETKTRAGGKALKFYAHVEFWTSTVKKIKKTVKGIKVQSGQKMRCRIKKNRMSGNHSDVDVTIIRNYGVDDICDNIDYLIDNKIWSLQKQSIVANEFDFKGSRDKLIKHIEENSLEHDLADIVSDAWHEFQLAAQPKRKPRYS